MHAHLDALKLRRESGNPPVYKQIAEAIEAAIQSGELPPGARLPTQRRLAQSLDVNVATVTNAYGYLVSRGLLDSTPGRGTCVKAGEGGPLMPDTAENAVASEIDLTVNRPASQAFITELAQTLPKLPKDRDFSKLQYYQPGVGAERVREAGRRWIAQSGLSMAADRIVVTHGVQHALLVAASAFLTPGDAVLADHVTYYGLRAVAQLLRLRLIGVDGDEQGMNPQAVEAACRESPTVKGIFVIPTMHNPTTVTMPMQRREAIAAVASRLGLWIIEDDVYGPLLSNRPAPIATYYPERTLYLSGTSKCLAPGLRVGFVATPPGLAPSLGEAVRAVSWMVQPMAATIVSKWIEDNRAAALIDAQRQALSQRYDVAVRLLSGYHFAGARYCPHIWVHLPEPWRSEQFSSFIASRGVKVLGSEAFMIDRSNAPHAVRINLGSAASQQQLERALSIIRSALGMGTGVSGSEGMAASSFPN